MLLKTSKFSLLPNISSCNRRDLKEDLVELELYPEDNFLHGRLRRKSRAFQQEELKLHNQKR
jgi:hypothetical protein